MYKSDWRSSGWCERCRWTWAGPGGVHVGAGTPVVGKRANGWPREFGSSPLAHGGRLWIGATKRIRPERSPNSGSLNSFEKQVRILSASISKSEYMCRLVMQSTSSFLYCKHKLYNRSWASVDVYICRNGIDILNTLGKEKILFSIREHGEAQK